jgi:multidrug efflux pump subunit AcrA (membrane-fusion protein)
LKVFRKSGELVDGTPATAILEVGDPTRLELVAIATAADLVRVQARDTVAVEVPSLPGLVLRGTVAAVSPAVDRATGLGSMRISLETPASGPRPPVGVAGVARIEIGAPHPATLVPAVALRAALGDEAEVVVCGADRRAHVVRVQRGIASGPLVEIRLPRGDQAGARADGGGGGAEANAPGAGTRVAVEPVLGLGEGDPIEPAP